MKGARKGSLAALVTLVAAVASLMPAGAAAFAGPWTDGPGDKAPVTHRYVVRLQKDEAAILAGKAEADQLAAQKLPLEDIVGLAVLKIEQDNAAFRYREAIRLEQVDLLQVAAQPDITDAVIRDAPAALTVILRDTVGAAFTASGTPHGGNELALHSILTLFMHLGMIVVTPGQGQPILSNPAAPYGATAITGASGDDLPTTEEQEAARAMGERVARIATWVSLGRAEWEQNRAPNT